MMINMINLGRVIKVKIVNYGEFTYIFSYIFEHYFYVTIVRIIIYIQKYKISVLRTKIIIFHVMDVEIHVESKIIQEILWGHLVEICTQYKYKHKMILHKFFSGFEKKNEEKI